jgi:hypothetical protein
MKTKDILAEVLSLPVEQRAMVADSILKSLSQPESEIDKKWAAVGKKRLSELQTGKVKPIPGKEVFRKIREHFSS